MLVVGFSWFRALKEHVLLVFSLKVNRHFLIEILSIYMNIRGGGALVFEVGYHPHKKIHIIRVVFQDQAMYVRTTFTVNLDY